MINTSEISKSLTETTPLGGEVWFIDDGRVCHGKIDSVKFNWQKSIRLLKDSTIFTVEESFGQLARLVDMDAERCYPSQEALKNALFPPSESNVLSFEIPFPLESTVYLAAHFGITTGTIIGYTYDIDTPLTVTVRLHSGAITTRATTQVFATREEFEAALPKT